MKNPKLVDKLEVFRDGERVGTLTRIADGSVFEYADDYRARSGRPIARHLPDGLRVQGVTNLPSFFAGLLPEGVMQDAVVRQYQLSKDDLFSQLAISGYDAVGDITTRVPGGRVPKTVKTPEEAVGLLRALQRTNVLDASPSLSGVQPKLSIGSLIAASRGPQAIVKVEPANYAGILENEHFFMRLAPKAGLRVAKVELGPDCVVVHRFDRIKRPGQPPNQVHVEDSLQLLNRYPLAKYSLDYLEILDIARELGAAKPVFLDLLRLYAYSFVIINGDLHAKNVSFAYTEQAGWSMTPAYDLVCTLPYFLQSDYGRRMALGLDEQFGAFTASDFRRIGEIYGLPALAINSMLTKVSKGVLAGISDIYEGFAVAIRDEIVDRARQIAP